MKVEIEIETGDPELDEQLCGWIKRHSSRLEEFEDREQAIESVLWAAIHFASLEDTFADYFKGYLSEAAEQMMG